MDINGTDARACQAHTHEQPTPTTTRRHILKTLGIVTALVPAACSYTIPMRRSEALQENSGGDVGERNKNNVFLVRDFHDSRLELLRLLREVAEIEHSLMLQYLYAAFSLKPQYADLVGPYAPVGDRLMGIAIQEMQHLGTVNRLLVKVGGSPCLMHQDFPYEPDIYPCTMSLEPMTRESVAKYVYAEAPSAVLDLKNASTPAEGRFVTDLQAALGPHYDGNHVGSVYRVLLALLKETAAQDAALLPDLDDWVGKLQHIMAEGEEDHFQYFKQAFMGTHAGFGGRVAPWHMPKDAADYPSYPLPIDPSGYIGHPRQYRDERVQALAWLSNLHYWTTLVLLDLHYRSGEEELKGLAVEDMLTGIFPLGRQLAKVGAGIPFDHLSMGYELSPTARGSLKNARALLKEADTLASKIQTELPTDYRFGLEKDLIARIDALSRHWQQTA